MLEGMNFNLNNPLVNELTQPMRARSTIEATEIVTDHLRKRTAAIKEELKDNDGKIDPVGLYANLIAQQEIALARGIILSPLPSIPTHQ